MSRESIEAYTALFLSRIDTLSHILEVSAKHFRREGDSIFGYRIAEDMLPFGTQVAFTCNQPRNFSLWCEGREMDNLSPEVDSLEQARNIIADTKARLGSLDTPDARLKETSHILIADGQYLELPGTEYLDDFLIPNFYFHLVTAYNIMRMKGAPLGKANYMLHLLPKVKQA